MHINDVVADPRVGASEDVEFTRDNIFTALEIGLIDLETAERLFWDLDNQAGSDASARQPFEDSRKL
jgi:hypothetical protein